MLMNRYPRLCLPRRQRPAPRPSITNSNQIGYRHFLPVANTQPSTWLALLISAPVARATFWIPLEV
jgi:hypothetical protein